MATSSGSATVFKWFQNLTTIANLFTWVSISVAYIRFYAALRAQGVDRSTLVFRSPFQPYTAYFSLTFFSLIILFNGFWVFPSKTKDFNVDGFITAYVGVPIYFGLFLFWKVFKRTRLVDPAQADITTGKAALDAAYWPERKARNWVEKVWFFIA